MDRPLFPKWLTIDVHNYCNASCTYCPWPELRGDKDYPKGTMGFDLFMRIIDEIAENIEHVEGIRFGNIAESLILDYIWMCMEYTLSKKVPLYLTSNMTHMTPAAMDRFDVMGWEGEVYAHVQPDMGVDYEEQQYHLEEARRRWGDRVVDTQILRPRKWPGDPELAWRPATYCYADRPLHTMIVNFDGRVQLCCNDVRQEEILGNLATETISDVWNGEGYKALFERMTEAKVELCNTCSWGATK